MPSIEFIDKDKKNGRVRFLLKDATPAFANTLRRTMLEDVPTMAIEDVEFRKNTALPYDEMIALRLGLVALTTDLKGYEVPWKCACEGKGCAKCTLTLTIKAKGPAMVTAADIESKDPAVKPVHPQTPIVQLLKGQELAVEAIAVLGRGRDHAKWSPGRIWYSYKPKVVEVNNGHKDFGKFKAKYPPQIFTKDGQIDKKLIEQHNLYDAVDDVNPDIVKVEYDPAQFVFHVEPWGQLSAKEIVTAALAVLEERLEDFTKALEATEK
jgi:DNA-directed RNA polymerase subunit D